MKKTLLIFGILGMLFIFAAKVFAAGTFGYSTQGASGGGWGADQTVGSQDGPAISGTGQILTAIKFYSNGDGTGTTNCKAYLTDTSYNIIANSISPGQLITGGVGTLQIFTYASGPSLTNGVTYYPWIICDGNWSTQQDGAGTGSSAFKLTGTTYASPSNPTSPTTQTIGRSIFGTYAAGSVVAPVTGHAQPVLKKATLILNKSTMYIQ